MTNELILIFDFGSQFAQLIARRVRELNVFCQVVRSDITAERVKQLKPKGIILSGGPASVYEAAAPKFDPKVLETGIPILGICYGMQLLAHNLGGKVGGTAHTREYGRATLMVSDPNSLFRGYPTESTVWMSHGDQVQNAGTGFVPLASTDSSGKWARTELLHELNQL